MIDMESPQFAGTKYDWTRTDPIQIRYDAQTNTAYFLEGKGSWVDRRSGAYSFPYRIYFQPFLEQLQTAAESQDPGSNTAFQQLFAERGFPMVDATAQSRFRH